MRLENGEPVVKMRGGRCKVAMFENGKREERGRVGLAKWRARSMESCGGDA